MRRNQKLEMTQTGSQPEVREEKEPEVSSVDAVEKLDLFATDQKTISDLFGDFFL